MSDSVAQTYLNTRTERDRIANQPTEIKGWLYYAGLVFVVLIIVLILLAIVAGLGFGVWKYAN